ncbi:hypothetical protein ACI2J9_03660 [Pseudomonas fulva]|uniref:hypothetical protein n=1 Tax=Pseudomonas fulva TaxID=47880 RepID=UPI00384F9752
MPNHITNKVSAPAHVLTSLINGDGRIDFGKIIKFEVSSPETLSAAQQKPPLRQLSICP